MGATSMQCQALLLLVLVLHAAASSPPCPGRAGPTTFLENPNAFVAAFRTSPPSGEPGFQTNFMVPSKSVSVRVSEGAKCQYELPSNGTIIFPLGEYDERCVEKNGPIVSGKDGHTLTTYRFAVKTSFYPDDPWCLHPSAPLHISRTEMTVFWKSDVSTGNNESYTVEETLGEDVDRFGAQANNSIVMVPNANVAMIVGSPFIWSFNKSSVSETDFNGKKVGEYVDHRWSVCALNRDGSCAEEIVLFENGVLQREELLVFLNEDKTVMTGEAFLVKVVLAPMACSVQTFTTPCRPPLAAA